MVEGMSAAVTASDGPEAFPTGARVVVIGGGIVGTSVAYHLTERGWRDVVLAGRITSAMFGHTIGRSIGLGYVRRDDGGPVDSEWLAGGRYEVEIATERFTTSASFRALYDPTNVRIRS